MSPRHRRLEADLRAMRRLVEETAGAVRFVAEGDPPERYTVELTVPGLARGAGGALVPRSQHRFDAYLHEDYPRQAPLLRWRTPVHHPNLRSPGQGGGVCLGAWAPSAGLDDVCRRLRDMVALEHWEPSGVLDQEAAAWLAARPAMEGGRAPAHAV
jgi:ubiquitin-protein ligase